jgi:hypothetical protein
MTVNKNGPDYPWAHDRPQSLATCDADSEYDAQAEITSHDVLMAVVITTADVDDGV